VFPLHIEAVGVRLVGKDIPNNRNFLCIQVGDKELKYILTRSNRKTIGIIIDKNGLVKVSSPLRVSQDYINQLLQEKSSWIQKKLNELEIRSTNTNCPKIYENGEKFLYFGKLFELKIHTSSINKKTNVRIENKYIVIDVPFNFNSEKIKDNLKKWYIKQFKQIIAERINHYSHMIGVFPNNVTIREQKTRWGSCSNKGNINLNWKLIMASLEILDYVVVHELCHMKVMNHSKEFWKVVEVYSPHYKSYREWLKHNGDMLSIE
jgi:predicted metal-dependent hydrolase